jgi:hypothetical protein
MRIVLVEIVKNTVGQVIAVERIHHFQDPKHYPHIQLSLHCNFHGTRIVQPNHLHSSGKKKAAETSIKSDLICQKSLPPGSGTQHLMNTNE